MNIGIAGAGLVGRLLAIKLGQLGWRVTLLDQGKEQSQQSCGYIAAGMLAPFAELETTESIIFELGMLSIALWKKWLEQLGCAPLLHLTGSILIAHPAEGPELLHFIQRIQAKAVLQHEARLLDQDLLAQLEPALALKGRQAYYFPTEGYLETAPLFDSLRRCLKEQGIAWLENQTVTKVLPYQIVVGEKIHQFDWTFDCRGLGAKNQLDSLRGVRGEIIYVHAPEVTLTRPIRLIHPRYPLYIVPRADQHYAIGASQIESEDFSPISVRTALELLSGAYSVHSGFAEARVINSYTNCRPAFANNLPQINHQPGLTSINGLFRHGYLLAPALIEQAMQYF